MYVSIALAPQVYRDNKTRNESSLVNSQNVTSTVDWRQCDMCQLDGACSTSSNHPNSNQPLQSINTPEHPTQLSVCRPKASINA